MENTRRATRPGTRDGARRLDDRTGLRDADGVDRDRRPRGRRWGASPQGAGATIFVGAVATWFAHAYASVLGHRATIRHHSAGEIGPALQHASSIVLAATPAVIAMGGASLGWWEPRAALGFANAAGIAVLAAAGWIVARSAGENLAGRLTATVVTASIGVGIVAVELVAHR